MMSTAIKGRTIEEARQVIRAFKALMSIHESHLQTPAGGGGPGEPEPATPELGDPELGKVRLGDLEALQGVVKFPVRIKCATLAWNTLEQALDELQS
jgi:nitrogen fixation NifU-like protein